MSKATVAEKKKSGLRIPVLAGLQPVHLGQLELFGSS